MQKKSILALMMAAAPLPIMMNTATAADHRDSSTTMTAAKVSLNQSELFSAVVKEAVALANTSIEYWSGSHGAAGVGQTTSSSYDCDGGGDGCVFANFKTKLQAAACKLQSINLNLTDANAQQVNDIACMNYFSD